MITPERQPAPSLLPVLAGLALLVLALGCARSGLEEPVFTSTAMATTDRTMTATSAERDALVRAERQARHQLMKMVVAYNLEDGGSLRRWIAMDPFLRSVLEDAIHSAPVVDRTHNRASGTTSVTIRMSLRPVLETIDERRETAATLAGEAASARP